MKAKKSVKEPKELQQKKVLPVARGNKNDTDKKIFDLVLKALYNNANKESLDLVNEILVPNSVKISVKEGHRLWNVLTGSGWISPIVGFGNAGKVELTKAGYQMMSQFGDYTQYLESMERQHQPQTIVLPMMVQEDDPQQPEARKGVKQVKK